MLCYVILSFVMLCYVILCYVMLFFVTLCYVILYYVMSCYVKYRKTKESVEKVNCEEIEIRT